jgi:hypothetical protein
MQDNDINLDAQPVDAAAEVSKPVVRTFIILKDTDRKDPTDGPGKTIVPVFRAYVDAPSEGYDDIDPESYSAPRAVLDAYLNIAQPDDIAGVWWVGKLPDNDEDAKYSYRGTVMSLERFNVAYVISINND